MNSIIKIKNLVKSYGDGDKLLVVLKGLSFDIQEGQFVSIVGRSGSGKSTLLYQLGLLDHPDSGEIEIANTDINSLDQEERTRFRLKELGYVFQDYALLPELTALENVAIPLMMQGLSLKEAYKLATLALEKIGLQNRLDNLPSQMSGGEQQRVSIARAIGHNPKIIFADEPTANLDTETADTVLKTFIDLNKKGQTIIMVTHEPEYAVMTERCLKLSDGVISIDGDPKKVIF